MATSEKKKLFPAKQEGSLLSVHGPVFLATPAVWRKLVRCSKDSFVKCTSEADKFSLHEERASVEGFPAAKLHNWIFVPSYNRFADSNPHQMRIDWADAMSQDTQFVRVIVVRSDKQQVLVGDMAAPVQTKSLCCSISKMSLLSMGLGSTALLQSIATFHAEHYLAFTMPCLSYLELVYKDASLQHARMMGLLTAH